ncbi:MULTISPECIES: carbohydrate-binding family 9-like protein [Olivibacter]|uniref:Carbohydrate-binding family 9-like protein n=1 Tax=Olivibacter jilunii TaxID=985016 RepID=A0ABW6AY14_9SPHI|nr:carbohydrate-binding family 9-like protein [Olivibacter sp. UJ_SKK_5.1]MDX3913173.1 carbohydrate-binding family 9-like protein [Pseudosphingobacterium sp.]
MSLEVPYIPSLDSTATGKAIRSVFSMMEAHAIASLNWKEYYYVPKVSFKIAYTDESILLYYEVFEKHIRAAYLHNNEPVYRDSCVEFFISFDGSNYYNFEFNCIGTMLSAYGSQIMEKRQLASQDRIGSIYRDTNIHATPNGVQWDLVANIPFSVFKEDSINSLKARECLANFYKCGDDLPIPHFLSWAPIDNPKPNFHLPAFFGKLHFAS